jgi:hypothetical protein
VGSTGRPAAPQSEALHSWVSNHAGLDRISVAGHLSFALKHEGIHLETLSRLFAAVPAPEIEAWIRGEPTGQRWT